MATSLEPTSTLSKESWLGSRADLAAVVGILLGLVARLWTASGTFLNPDEALHFRLANQLSLALAYKQSLTSAHPPLLIVLLYYWRALGTSELWLRLPSILTSLIFCWMFYKWLTKAVGRLAGIVGLLFVALLPPIVVLGAEIRQYDLLLAFLAGALYFLDEAFGENSPGRMAGFCLCLYLAMLSHYSAFVFAAALGVYALLRIREERPPARLVAAWVVGQVGGLALAILLYRTHLSQLGGSESKSALHGWESEIYLRHSYFERGHDNPLIFLVSHTFAVFQYIFGQLAVGDAMGVLFVVGVVLLLRGKDFPGNRNSGRRLGIFLLLPFAMAGAASLGRLYPYSGTRHVAYLIIPGLAAVSVAIVRLAAGSWRRALAISGVILAVSIALGKGRPPRMERADQNRAHMTAALGFIQQNVKPSDLIFTDYQTDLILGHYLCDQRPIAFESAPAGFEQFSCAGHRVVSTQYRIWRFWADNFAKEWPQFAQDYGLKPGDTVWVLQSGWGVSLPEDLKQHRPEFRDLRYQAFGANVKIFKVDVGETMAAASRK